ncbi:hypothetical protein [Absidia glauca]|uniref:Uncharacterized protein n=1 Tax=Absidia glauca TaxID=4829 RepID=A0A168SV94_ABSGL|nr:hypothetical protein [Absidia glauca]
MLAGFIWQQRRPLLVHHLFLVPGAAPPLWRLFYSQHFERARFATPCPPSRSSLRPLTSLALVSISATCPECPLHLMFTFLPLGQWLLKPQHRHLRAPVFITFDAAFHRLKILVPSEICVLPRLLRQFYRQVLDGIVRVAPPIWGRILRTDGALGSVALEPPLDALLADPLWPRACAGTIRRQCRLPLTPPVDLRFQQYPSLLDSPSGSAGTDGMVPVSRTACPSPPSPPVLGSLGFFPMPPLPPP